MRDSQLLSRRSLGAVAALLLGLAGELVPAPATVHTAGVGLCLAALGAMAVLGPLTAVRQAAEPGARRDEPPV